MEASLADKGGLSQIRCRRMNKARRPSLPLVGCCESDGPCLAWDGSGLRISREKDGERKSRQSREGDK